MNGYIAGFVSIEDCHRELERGIRDGTAEEGSFMVRFSENKPGALTFVFVSKSMGE